MTKPVLFIYAIRQKDNHTFTIQWNDGSICDYRLSELQKECPCASCFDINTRKSLIDPNKISDTLTAIKLMNVGRYALRIHFSSGCSNGIFGFDYLYEKGKK